MSNATLARLIGAIAFVIPLLATGAPPRLWPEITSATLRDGGTLHAGFAQLDGDVLAYSFAAWKTRPDGTPDPAFNGGDPVILPVWGYYEAASAILEQPDGRILLAGQAADPLYRGDLGCHPSDCHVHPAVIRLNADGSPDLSFNGTGKFVADVEAGDDHVLVLQDADGFALYEGRFPLGRLGPDGRAQSGFAEYPFADAQGLWHSLGTRYGPFLMAFSQQEEILFGVHMKPGDSPNSWQVFALPRVGAMKYQGRILEVSGPATGRAATVPPARDVADAGGLTVTFADRHHGKASFDFGEGMPVSLDIERMGGAPSACVFGAASDLRRAKNLTDFWNVKPLGSEPGWALFLTHSDDDEFIILWLTYDANGRPVWLSGYADANGGDIDGALYYRGHHAAEVQIQVRDGNEIDFAYAVPAGELGPTAVQGRATLTRFVYRAPGTACH